MSEAHETGPPRAIRVIEGAALWEIEDEGARLGRRRSLEAAMKLALRRAAVLFEAGVRSQVVLLRSPVQEDGLVRGDSLD